MSLSVYLYGQGEPQPTGSGIFVRENGATREISREEWDEKFPDKEPYRVTLPPLNPWLFCGNITHNLGAMADEADLYSALWRPEERQWTKARHLLPSLRHGLEKLKADPNHFRQFNPANGWGSYEQLVTFVRDYLKACEQYPDADVSVSR